MPDTWFFFSMGWEHMEKVAKSKRKVTEKLPVFSRYTVFYPNFMGVHLAAGEVWHLTQKFTLLKNFVLKLSIKNIFSINIIFIFLTSYEWRKT